MWPSAWLVTGAVGDLADRARAGTANDDGLRSALGCNDEVARTHACPDEIRSGDAQDAVGTGMRVAGGATVGEVGGLAAVELGRHEARALDSDVSTARQARPGNGVSGSLRVDRQDASAVLVGRDEVACVPAERRRRDLDAAFEPGGVRRDRAHPAGAIQREQRGAVRHRRRDQEPVTKAADVVERDAVGHRATLEVGEASSSSLGVDLDDPGRVARLDCVHGVRAERAGCAIHHLVRGERDVRLGAPGGRIAVGPTGKRGWLTTKAKE